MTDKLDDQNARERDSRLIDALVSVLPKSQQAAERVNLEEWEAVKASASSAYEKWITVFSGLAEDAENLNGVILRLAEIGADFMKLIQLAEPSGRFFDQLGASFRDGEGKRSMQDHERIFKPGTMNDFASFLLVWRWSEGLQIGKTEFPPFACWTDKAVTEFLQWAIDFPADWQAVRDRRNFYGLVQPRWILVDGIEYERISGEGEEIEMGEGIRLCYCKKSRPRKAT